MCGLWLMGVSLPMLTVPLETRNCPPVTPGESTLRVAAPPSDRPVSFDERRTGIPPLNSSASDQSKRQRKLRNLV